jgi:hypothetical protein
MSIFDQSRPFRFPVEMYQKHKTTGILEAVAPAAAPAAIQEDAEFVFWNEIKSKCLMQI